MLIIFLKIKSLRLRGDALAGVIAEFAAFFLALHDTVLHAKIMFFL